MDQVWPQFRHRWKEIKEWSGNVLASPAVSEVSEGHVAQGSLGSPESTAEWVYFIDPYTENKNIAQLEHVHTATLSAHVGSWVERRPAAATHDPGFSAFHLLSKMFVWQSVHQSYSADPLVQYCKTWREQIEDKMTTAVAPTVPASGEGTHFILCRRKSTTHKKEEEEGKKTSITQRLEEQAGELLGRRDCHVCINRHWFFCPALAPQPFILSFVAGAQRGWRNSVTVQLGPWGLCVRIDFTCKLGEGLEPLNKGRLCHQRARRVKSHWMDNDTCCEKRMKDRERRISEIKEMIDTVRGGETGKRRRWKHTL